jgi:hypothetical protein
MNRIEPVMDQLSKLLAEAASLPLTRSNIEALVAANPVDRLREGLARAVSDGDVHAATALVLAIGAGGGRITPEQAIWLMPDLDDIQNMPIIAGIVEGDRLTMLLDVVDGQRLSWQRESLALYLATQLLDGAEPPRRLVAALRTLAREQIPPETALVVALAARALGNKDIGSLVSTMMPSAELSERRGSDKLMIAGFYAPVLDSLPVEGSRVIASGYTAVRSEPKVGRNDPCPCGSGRKFKKCCAGKQQETSSRQSLVEQFQRASPRGEKVQNQIFEELRPGELARLNPAELTTFQLITAFRKLVLHRRWDDAERFIEALATRSDLPQGNLMSKLRQELAEEALRAGNLDLLERHLALADVSEYETLRLRINLALARKAPESLQLLEALAGEGHSLGLPVLLFDCAFALLRHSPALGILAARGCIDRERFLDSEALLMEIDRARDRLGLSPKEPWWDIFDHLLDEGLAQSEPLPPAANEKQSEEEDRRQREIDQMRADLQAAQSTASRLDRELSSRIEDLESLTSERKQLAAIVQASGGGEYQKRVSHLEEERQRLRSKIGELKGEISSGVAQRAELRRELAETADALRRENRASGAEEDADEQDGVDEAEGESAATRPRKILVPHYSPAASRSLSDFPMRVATDALRMTALLAAGDAHAWSGVKHMHGAHDVLSIRIGRPYRVLFRIADDRLDILDVILRRDLDAALLRLSGR